MTIQVKSPTILSATFLWIGIVSAISFLEAPLKFQAPGITLPLGLGIGRLVFGALNKVEWGFGMTILLALLIRKERILASPWRFYLPVMLLLTLQTFWLLPLLDARAVQVIQGADPSPSASHWYYVGCEVLKIMCLVLFGIKQFEQRRIYHY